MNAFSLVTAAQIREMDRRAMQELGIPGSVLMENAGQAVVQVLCEKVGKVNGKRVLIFCGGGNNGGDGYVIARRLALSAADTQVVMLAAPASLKGDAAIHFAVLKASGLGSIRAFDPETTHEVSAYDQVDVVIDALLGTGLEAAPRSDYAAAISLVNRLKRSKPALMVVAVDVPSGISSDTGAVNGEAIRADITVTFARPKLGLYLPPASEYAGEICVQDIGICWDTLDPDGAPRLIPDTVFETLLDRRAPESNKGDFGHVGIIAGSRGMTGAPVMAARAAQRAGAGLVTVLTPSSAQASVSTRLDEQMTIGLAESEEGALCMRSLPAIAAFASRASALCIGPGITTSRDTAELLDALLSQIATPLVLDADALNIVSLKPQILFGRTSVAPVILTPHPGEAARLLGTTVLQVQSNRLASVREIAARYGCIVVLKGRYTLISDPEGNVLVNTTGNPGMATGGMGDTLTGIAGAFLARMSRAGKADTVSAMHAASAAVHIHGLAGDIAAAHIGQIGLTAGDVGDCIAAAINRRAAEYQANGIF